MGFKTYFRLLQSFFWDSPPYLIFFVTSKCNSKCRHCFYWKEIKESANKKELSLEEIEKIARNYGKLLFLSIGGGEPSLRKDIPEICELFHKFTGVSFITWTTNGLLPKKISGEVERALKKCPDVEFRIPLSIDGIRETQDYMRGVPGSFDRVIETYNGIVKLQKKYKNISIDVNTVVSSYNQDEIEKIFEFVKIKMPQIRNHGICFARGATKDEKAKDISLKRLKQIVKFREEMNKNSKKSKSLTGRLFQAIASIGNEWELKFIERKEMDWDCLAGKRFAEINEVGEVFPCEMIWEKIGSLRKNNYDIRKILKHKKTQEIIQKIRRKECPCTFECAMANSLIYSPKKYFKVMNKLISEKT